MKGLWLWVQGRQATGRAHDPRDRIAAVRLERNYHDGKTVQRDEDELRVVVGNQTDVLVQLTEPVDGVRRVRFRADEPTACRGWHRLLAVG